MAKFRNQAWFFLVPGFIWIAWTIGMSSNGQWHLFVDNWFMTVTMCVGSFIAGATSEGGGAVAFPVMTLVFGIAPSVARDFSLFIQSVGMTAAAFLILGLRIRIEWRAILFASLGGSLGIIVGLEFLSPRLPAPVVKMLFTTLWLSFGMTLFWLDRNSKRVRQENIASWQRSDAYLLTGIGFLGGMVSGLTGSGLDILTFSLLTLYFRVSEKVATPTSVVLMAINAILGTVWRSTFSQIPVDPRSWDYWAVCVPVVVVGAPIGAYLIQQSTKRLIVRILCGSILIQFLGAILIIPQTPQLIGFTVIVLGIGLSTFSLMESMGRERIDTDFESKLPSGSMLLPNKRRPQFASSYSSKK